ncbi:hypothetical protein GCM10009539_08370 [Cryptosporangium japonicum]|uniref:Uncharacterized protein n=2 Tax=Cryptosporangium japonicum TaxID=80872 RepID=A0ABN0TMI1_9ACTN
MCDALSPRRNRMPAVVVVVVILSSVTAVDHAVALGGSALSALVAVIGSLALLAEATTRFAALSLDC